MHGLEKPRRKKEKKSIPRLSVYQLSHIANLLHGFMLTQPYCLQKNTITERKTNLQPPHQTSWFDITWDFL